MKGAFLYLLTAAFLLLGIALATPIATVTAAHPTGTPGHCGNSQNDCKTQTPDHLKATATRNPHGGPCGNSYVDCKETATAIAATPKPTRNPCAGDEGPSEYCATKTPRPTATGNDPTATATAVDTHATPAPPSPTASPGRPTTPTQVSSPAVPTATTQPQSHSAPASTAPAPPTASPISTVVPTLTSIPVQLTQVAAIKALPHTGDVDLGLLLSIGLALPGVGILVRRILG